MLAFSGMATTKSMNETTDGHGSVLLNWKSFASWHGFFGQMKNDKQKSEDNERRFVIFHSSFARSRSAASVSSVVRFGVQASACYGRTAAWRLGSKPGTN